MICTIPWRIRETNIQRPRIKNERRWTWKWLGWLNNALDRGVSSCNTKDECLWVVDQIGGVVADEDMLKQSFMDEKTCEFEVSE